MSGMSTQAELQLLTAEEFFQLSDPADGGKMELVRGRVVNFMPVSGKHGIRALLIGQALRQFVVSHKLGECMVETGYILARNPDVVRAPDVSFLAADRVPAGGVPEEGFIDGVPSLAIEVVSPNDLDSEVTDKVLDYLEAGCERVWVVRPRRNTVTIHYANGTARILSAGTVLTSDDAGFTVPGFELPLDELFA